MMIPITRKEKYINEIVGGGNTAPETPQTREELFYAAILGEVVAPSPITRVEKYLSAIAGQYNGELPEPVTRIERFIARAAGMDVTIPTPITREEMFWANYALIIEKELSGIPPLTFNAIAGSLKNYRIYGNTVNGESVGNLVTDSQSEHYGEYAIPITNNSETLTIYLDEPLRKIGDEAEYIDFEEQKMVKKSKTITFTNSNGWVTESNNNFYTDLPLDGALVLNYVIENSMNIPSVYVTLVDTIAAGVDANIWVSSTGRLNVYLTTISHTLEALGQLFENTPLTITYELANMNELDVALPTLPTLSGTNTLSVETTVQPSKVYAKYKGAR